MDLFKKKVSVLDQKNLIKGKLFLKRRYSPESLLQIYKVSLNTMKHWEPTSFNQYSEVFFDVYEKYLNDSLGDQQIETHQDIITNIKPVLISLFEKKLKQDFNQLKRK